MLYCKKKKSMEREKTQEGRKKRKRSELQVSGTELRQCWNRQQSAGEAWPCHTWKQETGSVQGTVSGLKCGQTRRTEESDAPRIAPGHEGKTDS